MLVEHPQNGTTGQLRHILIIVLDEGFLVDQALLIHFVQLLIIFFGIILVGKNLRYPILHHYTAIVRMADQMLRCIEQPPVSPV
ncbi:hypothetical protein D3C85_1610800 [compost metagenome]